MSARSRQLLLALLLVLSGSVLTLLIQRVLLPPRAPTSTEQLHRTLLTQMDSALQLTPAQRDSVHAIFMRHQSTVDTAWLSITRRMHAAMDSVHRELEAVLEPAQIAAFRDLIHGRGSRHHPQH